jgi:hypothetical protein
MFFGNPLLTVVFFYLPLYISRDLECDFMRKANSKDDFVSYYLCTISYTLDFERLLEFF